MKNKKINVKLTAEYQTKIMTDEKGDYIPIPNLQKLKVVNVAW